MMSRKVLGRLSHRIDAIVKKLAQAKQAWRDNEVADAINQALKKEGFKQRVTAQSVSYRRRKQKIVTGNLRRYGEDQASRTLPSVTIDLPKAVANDGFVWNQNHQATVKRFFEQSRKTADPIKLGNLKQELLKTLQQDVPDLTSNGLRQYITREKAVLGAWGLSKDSDGNESDDIKPLSKKALAHLAFARVWNNKRIRIKHEIQRAVQIKGQPLPSWKDVWKTRDRYRRYLVKHPEYYPRLPTLIVRQFETGEPKDLHPFVELHLDEWKYDRKRIKKARGFVIGNYQWGAVPASVIATAKQYAEHRGFEFIVGLSQYGRIEVDLESDELLTVLPDELRGHIVVDDVIMADFRLDCNTHLVQTSDVYLTDSVCAIAGERNTIFLGTKQEMRHWMRLEHDYPACYMTTGSLNEPHHKRTRLGKNNKAVAVAKSRHEYGFVVLEIVKDDSRGHFAIPRQLWATVEGHLYDIDPVHGGARLYTPDGHEHRPSGIDTQKNGDLHEAGVDEEIWRITHEGPDSISSILRPKHVHLGDTFDNKWGNPYRPQQTVRAAYQSDSGLSSIRHELEACLRRLRKLQELLPAGATITLEPSNHSDDWLKKWVNRGNLQEDPANSPLLCELWLAVYHELHREGQTMADKDAVEEKSPFGLYIRSHLPQIQCPSYQELDQVMRPPPGPGVLRRVYMTHGHIGPKGVETLSIRSFAGFNKKVVGGHVHSATRLNGNDQVGVMTKRLKHYVRGPKTNWTNSHLVVFENGYTAHIMIINGRWYGDSVDEERRRVPSKKK